MMTLYQRLVLGGLLLVGIVTGVSMLVRASFFTLAGVDASQHTADAAIATFADARAALASEEMMAARIDAGSSVFPPELVEQQKKTQLLFAAARTAVDAFTPSASISSLESEHRAIMEHRRESFGSLADQLSRLSNATTQSFDRLRAQHNALIAHFEHQRSRLRARLISACGAAILTAIAVGIATIFFVISPIRSTAKTVRRIAQGDLQQRIEWRQKDDLGTITAEMNRMVARLRDLRESESGRLQMEHQLSDAVVQSIFEPVIVTDAKGHVRKLNQAAVELLGEASADRMVLANTPGGEKILEAIRMAISMQRAATGEGEAFLLPMSLGEEQRSYRLRTTPMRDSEGKLLGSVTVLEDVTQLQEVDRFKTKFLSVASQKLRDPLERLRLSLYALSRGYAGELRPLQSDLLTGAEQEAEGLQDLMADLIEVSELESGRRKMRIEKFRPIDILNDGLTRHQAAATQKNIAMEMRAFADLSYVTADRRAIRSILDNLLTNAIRYTPEGGAILLEATELKDTVQFFVRDSGRGIEAERLPGIFGRFSGESDSEIGSGTGLGLALVRRLVETLGGQTSVESKPNSGTTFSFTLPVATISALRHPVEAG